MSLIKDTFKILDGVSQDIGKHIYPSTVKALEHFGEHAGNDVGVAADDVWKALLGARDQVGKYAGPAVGDIGKALDGYGQEVRKHIEGALKDAEQIDLQKLPTDVKEWIEQHPEQTAGILCGLVAAPLAVAATPVILGAFGFTAGGITTGIQSGIGNVAANSLFSTLMSAGAGGAGLPAVQGVVGGLAGAVGIVANVPGLAAIAGEGNNEQSSEEKEHPE